MGPVPVLIVGNPMKLFFMQLACLGALVSSSITTAQDAPSKPEIPAHVLHETFDNPPEEPAWALRKHSEGKSPEVRDGALHLLSGKGGENNSAAWPMQAEGEYRRVKGELVFTMTEGARGMSFMLLHTSHFARKGRAFYLYKQKGFPGDPPPSEPLCDEPNLWGSFAVALDCHNPPSEDPFNEHGNVYDRPQREVSLHFDGREIVNRFCEPEFVTGKACVLAFDIAFVTGGAEITIGVGGQSVYDSYFIPHMLPYESRAAVGAYGPDGGTCSIDSLHVDWSPKAAETISPLTVKPVTSGWSRKGKAWEGDVHLLPTGNEYERVIMTLRLKPMVERDEWDRLGHVWVWDNETRIELARILTPFMLWGTTYEYVCDVTDFGHLLDGNRKMGVNLGAYVGNGFVFDLEFTYYRRPSDVAALPKVVSLQNVWNGTANFNNAESVANTFGVRKVKVPADAKSARLRVVVTGHGSLEFKPMNRTIRVGDKTFESKLWTQNCYLNPWRPQFGTWKYDRAGWGPGAFGDVCELDLSSLIKPGIELELEYTSEEYKAEGWASHVIESQVVFYAE